jgi:HEAT repeat protein
LQGQVSDEEQAEALGFLRRFFSVTVRQRARLVRKAPLAAIQATALGHPDALMRRQCLFFLDHYANEASMAVFSKALHDPVDFVRNIAVHSLACESCKTGALIPEDVVPGLVEVLEHDTSVELRCKVIPQLMRLAGHDARAGLALEAASREDPDSLVRQAAGDAVAGRWVAPRKRYERRQRRHGKRAPRAVT